MRGKNDKSSASSGAEPEACFRWVQDLALDTGRPHELASARNLFI